MVRFSDIIETSRKKNSPEQKAQDQDDRLWLSDSQVLQVRQKASADQDSRDAQEKEAIASEAETIYNKFTRRAIDIRDRVQSDLGISPSPILADLHHVIDHNLIDPLYEYAMRTSQPQEDMPVHSVDVTFACLRVGQGLNYDTKKLLQLGLAAFLENVGMYKIPNTILNKKGRLDSHEILVIKNHPQLSSQTLNRMGDRYQWLAEVVLQTHERSDGSGYPRGLKEDSIAELAAIIGLIDTYLAMIKNRPYRDKFIQTDAVKFILKEAKNLFPAKILKIFLSQISLFPVNSWVRLNNKSIGRVVSTDRSQPLRPTIELFYDNQGKKLETREIIQLSQTPLLYIVESIDENSLT
jgi:HD-GYP domain-containing protein (c-di-GMP phosphodiesterase class II)